MPEPEFVRTMQRFRERLLSRERDAEVRLVNAYGTVYERLQDDIDALIDQIEAMENPTRGQVRRLARLRNLKRSTVELITDRYAPIAENELDQGARAALQAAQDESRRMVRAALPGIDPIDTRIMQSWRTLPDERIETLLGFLDEGGPIKSYLNEQLGADVAAGVEAKLLEGVGLGSGPRKIAREIRNELGQGLTWSLRTSRTVQVYTYRETNRANYIANSDIVPGWRWRATRDGRTCMSCLAMDGTEHGHDETLNDHWNGRCFMEPMTVSYRDLGLDVDEPQFDRQTGEEWFKGLPRDQQISMMGKAKHEAWEQGAFDFRALTTEQDDRVFDTMRTEASLKQILGTENAQQFYRQGAK